MADRTRAFDWSATPIGPIEQWPETLLITVNTLLSSRHPMFLWWGKDLIQFYNDAYRPSIREDKHPAALGQAGRECWPEIWTIIGPQIEAVMQHGEASWHEDQLVPINRNGRLEDVYWTYGYSPVRDPSGAICGTLVVCTETTDSVRARQQLRIERERMADIFQQAPAFFAVLGGPDFVFEMINPRYQELVGQRSVLGRPLREAVPESDAQGFLGLIQEVYRTGEPHVGRGTEVQLARVATQPMEIRYLDFVYQPRRDADGTISGVIVLGVDVTETKRAEQILLQTEKLAAVGRMASSIAHEINNPLEAVTNLLYLARAASISRETQQYLASAEMELRRVSVIANRTLRFHRDSRNCERVEPLTLMEETLSLYQSRLNNARVVVQKRMRASNPLICIEGDIRQVLSNLIGNAIDAMPQRGGRLILRSRNGRDWRTGRTGVTLTIADTGAGMSPDTVSKIFEPFFTTKESSGTGLGLWISQEIVDRHHGLLKVRSSTVQWPGTVFALFLPGDEDQNK
jgi:PAS domain S-box-containing protein